MFRVFNKVRHAIFHNLYPCHNLSQISYPLPLSALSTRTLLSSYLYPPPPTLPKVLHTFELKNLQKANILKI